MNAPTSIWVDVTTLVNWRRPAVGIIRVEQQLCLWLLQHTPQEVHFCRYERDRGQFYEVGSEAVSEALQRIAAYDVKVEQDSARRPLGRLQRTYRYAVRLTAYLPPRLGVAITNALTRAKPRILRALQAVRALAARFGGGRALLELALPGEPVDLPSGSVYVSLGLDWDYKDMAHLYHLKQERALSYLFFCYDTIPVRLPQLCVADVSRQFVHYFADLAWAADLVLCISESTQRDLNDLLFRIGVPSPATAVIRLGGDILPGNSGAAPLVRSEEIARFLEQPFILFVSTIERRKNHETLYRAYARLVEQNVQLPLLVFVGMQGWGVQELMSDLALDPRVSGLIRQLNHVSDADLAMLYRHSAFTVYPSLYEGWGLPVAESLAFGKFCLCSNTSSLPEVGEGWVEYLDPWDLPGWVERLRYYITNPEEVARRNASIAAGYRPHPWTRTAENIYTHARQLLPTCE